MSALPSRNDFMENSKPWGSSVGNLLTSRVPALLVGEPFEVDRAALAALELRIEMRGRRDEVTRRPEKKTAAWGSTTRISTRDSPLVGRGKGEEGR